MSIRDSVGVAEALEVLNLTVIIHYSQVPSMEVNDSFNIDSIVRLAKEELWLHWKNNRQ